jgi:RHS repeat-associated protein
MSYTQGSVDPRTGLYTFSIEIPPLNANDLQGPELPLSLNFNPLNESNAGFGIGWSLKLSRYDLDSGVLDLHTGDSFAIADNGPNEPVVVHERKFDSFHVANISNDKGKRYRIAHKAGLVELLEPLKAAPRVCLPTRVMTPSGHGITLAYDDSKGRLASIHDDSGLTLLTVTFNGDHEAVLDLHPGTEAHVSFTLALEGEELRTLVMPTTDQHSWTFDYTSYGSLRCLQKLVNPLGGEEELVYKEQGHQLPGLELFVPYATSLVVKPDRLDETTFIKTEYDFSKNNFLGYGASGVVWEENYNQDHLYKFTGSTFNYTSTVKHHYEGKVLRTVTRTFNRFHLLAEQVTEESGCTETMKTEYHERSGGFAEQEERLQLPSKMTKTWTVSGNPVDRRDEFVTFIYDKAGNLEEERTASGIRMVRTYYPATKSDGCPADQEGFKRNLESITVYPADDAATGKPATITRTRYTYKAMDVLSATASLQQASYWLVADSEETLEVTLEDDGKETEQRLRRVEMSHLNMPDNVLLHGRSDLKTATLGACTSKTRWHYEKINDEQGKPTYLKTTTTFSPHGGTIEKTSASVHSSLRNRAIEEEDANGVVTRYRYDSLNRLLEQTVAPDDPDHAATVAYDYGQVIEDKRSLWYAQITDSNKVITRAYHDGLERSVRVERTLKDLNDPSKTITRITSKTQYDSIGRVASETQFDYLPAPPDSDTPAETVVELTSSYAYDAWGQRCEVTRPDLVKEITEFSPFGEKGNKTTMWSVSPDKPGDKQQLRVVEYNTSEKPVYEYLLLPVEDEATKGISWVEIDRTDYTYDGLSRCIKETFSPAQTRKQKPLVTEYTYDNWGRMCETVRADGSKLLRTFAAHSVSELTTLLEVLDTRGDPAQPVCSREYDGLDRLTRMAVGPRVEKYQYRGLTQLVEKRSISNSEGADKRTHVTHYEYKPNLTTQPSQVAATFEDVSQPHAPDASSFDYFPSDAQISSAANSNGNRTYSYTDQGYLAHEYWKVNDQAQYDIHNAHSLDGRLIYRKHSDGIACHYGYDTLGRLQTISQDQLECTLEYNSEGLLEHTTTRDAERYVRTTQTYDPLGRQHRRTLNANGEIRVLVLKWRDGKNLESRTLYRDNDDDVDAFIRKEVFGYDELDRLTTHDYEGDWDSEEADGERWQALPRNAAGRSIIAQTFDFDALDNLSRCRTDFADGERDTARFTYAEDSSFQLTKVTHTLLADYRAEQTFLYDARGNMLNDEQGRKLEYDSHGRLQRVLDANDTELMKYLYDGHDQLFAATQAGKAQVQRRYLGNSLDSTQENDLLTQYLYGDGQAVGVQRANQNDNQLLLTDTAGSVVAEVDSDGTRHASYSAYGEQPENNGLRNLLAFNGELREAGLGWYLLGSGYRAYNPNLMRFHSPDSLPPEVSGPNPYVYALGNPVKWRDPTGHRVSSVAGGDVPPDYVDPPPKASTPIGAWIGVGFAAVALVVSAGMMALPLAAGAGAVASTAVLAKASITVIGQGVALAMQVGAAVVYNSDPETSNVLMSTAFGVQFITGFVGGTSLYKLWGIRAALKSANAIKASANLAKFNASASTTRLTSRASLPNISTRIKATPIRLRSLSVGSSPVDNSPLGRSPVVSSSAGTQTTSSVGTQTTRSVGTQTTRSAGTRPPRSAGTQATVSSQIPTEGISQSQQQLTPKAPTAGRMWSGDGRPLDQEWHDLQPGGI